LKRLGCEVREISLPATDYAIACYYIIATAEASSNLARYDGVLRHATLEEMWRPVVPLAPGGGLAQA